MAPLIELLQHYGLGLVFLNVFALQAGAPVPAYPTLIAAGALLSGGIGGLVALVATGAAAAILADTIWYVAGRRYGTRVLKTLCRISLSQDSCVRQTENIFARFGPQSMMFAKFVPGFASVSTAMAGAIRLPYWKFLLFDLVGALLWVGVGVGLGYVFRDAIGEVLDTLAALGKWGLILVVSALALYIAVKWLQRRMLVRQLRMDRVTVAELKAMMAGNRVRTILDVRSPLVQQASGRIPGARPVDLTMVGGGLEGVPSDGEVVVYCACPNEVSAVKVAQELKRLGYKRVRPLHGGIDAWISAGFEVELSVAPEASAPRERANLSTLK
jgi:membrane protein DedA with SNARE-associated domain/rhodanese-related sulfurtransferase